MDLEQIATTLDNSDNYRVIRKYQKPNYYHTPDNNTKILIGVFLDIESTGLSAADDKLIELGMVKFEYSMDGRIFRILDEFNQYQDPCQPISQFITKLTGINNQMVQNKKIDPVQVAAYLAKVDLIIAHNASFDRVFFEKSFPTLPPIAWACSMHDINWSGENIESLKLEYIAYKYNVFYEGHRAITDCLVGIHLLAQQLYNSKKFALKQLLDNALQPRFQLWAKGAPYEHKDILKSRKYRWNTHPVDNFKSWTIQLPQNQVEDEINFLKNEIYNHTMNIPFDIFDAYSRFSSKYIPSAVSDTHRHLEKWVQELQYR